MSIITIENESAWRRAYDKVANSDLDSYSKLVCHTYNWFTIIEPQTEITISFLSQRSSLSPRTVLKKIKLCILSGFDIQVKNEFSIKNRWQIMRAKVFDKKGSHCFYCGEDAWHVDHVIAKSKGGSDEIGNLVPACGACNISKGNKSLDEWRGLNV